MMLVDDDGLTRVDQVGFSARQVRIAGHRKGALTSIGGILAWVSPGFAIGSFCVNSKTPQADATMCTSIVVRTKAAQQLADHLS